MGLGRTEFKFDRYDPSIQGLLTVRNSLQKKKKMMDGWMEKSTGIWGSHELRNIWPQDLRKSQSDCQPSYGFPRHGFVRNPYPMTNESASLDWPYQSWPISGSWGSLGRCIFPGLVLLILGCPGLNQRPPTCKAGSFHSQISSTYKELLGSSSGKLQREEESVCSCILPLPVTSCQLPKSVEMEDPGRERSVDLKQRERRWCKSVASFRSSAKKKGSLAFF